MTAFIPPDVVRLLLKHYTFQPFSDFYTIVIRSQPARFFDYLWSEASANTKLTENDIYFSRLLYGDESYDSNWVVKTAAKLYKINKKQNLQAALNLRLVSKSFSRVYGPKYIYQNIGGQLFQKEYSITIRWNGTLSRPYLIYDHAYLQIKNLKILSLRFPSTYDLNGNSVDAANIDELLDFLECDPLLIFNNEYISSIVSPKIELWEERIHGRKCPHCCIRMLDYTIFMHFQRCIYDGSIPVDNQIGKVVKIMFGDETTVEIEDPAELNSHTNWFVRSRIMESPMSIRIVKRYVKNTYKDAYGHQRIYMPPVELMPNVHILPIYITTATNVTTNVTTAGLKPLSFYEIQANWSFENEEKEIPLQVLGTLDTLGVKKRPKVKRPKIFRPKQPRVKRTKISFCNKFKKNKR